MNNELSFGTKEWQLAYRVALKVLKAPDQAEDAAQDALMNAYTARHTFAGRAKPESWLYRIAYNTALSYLRRPFAKRYTSADVFQLVDERAHLEPGSPPIDTPEGTAIAEQLATSLGSCLSTMRKKDRIAFTERFIHGTSERELGEMLGVSANAAKQRAFRARRAVRSCISCRETER
jgi:RNA polymerase sigma-70 factor (ECF subfamily)